MDIVTQSKTGYPKSKSQSPPNPKGMGEADSLFHYKKKKGKGRCRGCGHPPHGRGPRETMPTGDGRGSPGRRGPGESRPQGDEAPGWRCRQGIPREAEFFDYWRYLMPTVTGVIDGTQNQRANRIIDFFQFLNL